MYLPSKIEHLLLPPPKPVDAVGQILLDAVLVLRKYGHRKGDFGDLGEGFCAMGAVKAVDCRLALHAYIAAGRRVMRQLGFSNSDTIEVIFRWNDHPTRTADEVIAALTAAAYASAD